MLIHFKIILNQEPLHLLSIKLIVSLHDKASITDFDQSLPQIGLVIFDEQKI